MLLMLDLLLFSWVTALLSVTVCLHLIFEFALTHDIVQGCYLVISMERLARREIPVISREPVFTSRLEVDDSGVVSEYQ